MNKLLAKKIQEKKCKRKRNDSQQGKQILTKHNNYKQQWKKQNMQCWNLENIDLVSNTEEQKKSDKMKSKKKKRS